MMNRRLFSGIMRKPVCDAIAKYSSTRPGLIKTPHFSNNQNEARKYGLRKLSISTDLSTDRKLLRMAPTCNANVVSSPFPPLPQRSDQYLPMPEFASQRWKNASIKDEVAIIDGTTRQQRTFGQYDHLMRSFGAFLKEDMHLSSDYETADTVSLFLPNHVDYVPLVLGVGMLGCKVTPVNPLYTPLELSLILEQSKSKILVTHEVTLKVALEALQLMKHNYVKQVICIPAQDDGQVSQESVLNVKDFTSHSCPLERSADIVWEQPHLQSFLLPYSSGTTGLPKGVCVSHTNLVANLLQLEAFESKFFPPGSTLISPLPMFHLYGLSVSALYAAWQSQKSITNSGKFDLESFCSLVQEHRPQRAHLVPPILLGLTVSDHIVKKYNLSSLKMIISGAAPLSSDLEGRVQQVLSGCKIKQAWGMSELSGIGAFTSDDNIRPGSVGQLPPSTYGKILSIENQASVGPGIEGELCIKGPQIMLGYENAEEKTAECLDSEGWIRTGDIAYYDEEGFFYITDRIKELIKVRGFPVAPAELEHLLLQNERVQDVAVIGVPCKQSGEVPRAFVVLHGAENGSILDENVIVDEIKAWVKERVAPAKRIEGGLVIVDAVPKSASGKILRRLLREQVRKDSKV